VAAPAGEDNEQADWVQRDFGLAAPIASHLRTRCGPSMLLLAGCSLVLGAGNLAGARSPRENKLLLVQFFLKKILLLDSQTNKTKQGKHPSNGQLPLLTELNHRGARRKFNTNKTCKNLFTAYDMNGKNKLAQNFDVRSIYKLHKPTKLQNLG
jgi:hypothetical protein